MPEVAWRVHTRHAIPDTALPLYGPHVVPMTSAGEKRPIPRVAHPVGGRPSPFLDLRALWLEPMGCIRLAAGTSSQWDSRAEFWLG